MNEPTTPSDEVPVPFDSVARLEHSAAQNTDGDELLIQKSAAPAADPAASPPPRPKSPRRRRRALPLALFLLTCVSTFFAGATNWLPTYYLFSCVGTMSLMPLRRAMISHWDDGLIYAACVLAILLTHEMGHFLTTHYYRIPTSFPYFLPLPISPIGTMGAVIGMDGMKANRRELFDIGIAGPLAGLVVALPIMWIGLSQLEFKEVEPDAVQFDTPLLVDWALEAVQPPGYVSGQTIAHSALNPFFMAGWVGLLVTGLNMMPVGQLDGGHITYALLLRRAHFIARIFMAITVILMVLKYVTWQLSLMVFLVLFLMGTDHPKTSNDRVPLGWFRRLLGLASLSIPLLCFAPHLIIEDHSGGQPDITTQQAQQDQPAAGERPPIRRLVSRHVPPGNVDPERN